MFYSRTSSHSHCQGMSIPRHVQTSNTIQNFLESRLSNDHGVTTWALQAKAVILWERALLFARKITGSLSFSSLTAKTSPSNSAGPSSPKTPLDSTQADFQPLMQEFGTYTALLDSVFTQLPPGNAHTILSSARSSERGRRLAVAYTLLHLAVLVLHGPFAYAGRSDTSRHQRVASARQIMEMAIALRTMSAGYLNPIIGVCVLIPINENSAHETDVLLLRLPGWKLHRFATTRSLGSALCALVECKRTMTRPYSLLYARQLAQWSASAATCPLSVSFTPQSPTEPAFDPFLIRTLGFQVSKIQETFQTV